MVSIQRVAWVILALVSASLFGNFYVYDSIGPVAELLQTQRGFSDTQIGMLNAIYSLPNVVLVLVGGVLSDRFGAGRMTMWTAGICLAGAALTAWGPGYEWMAGGRLLFGIGAETFNISTLAAVVPYFAGRQQAFAVGVTLAVGRMGSYAADMSPEWFAGAYATGWQAPMVIAVGFSASSLVAAVLYWWIDKGTGVAATPSAEKFVARDLLRFGRAYWYLLVLCVLFYAVILAFRSTFSIKYFQHAHGLTLGEAGTMNSYVFLAAVFATPVFGWLSDRTGRYAPMLAFGAFLLPVALAIMAGTGWSLWVATALIGVSYSLVPAVMWPLASQLVAAERLGTALGLMFVVQNAGMAGANLAAGWLNDWAGASAANPAGYLPMMWFFGVMSTAGFLFAVLLWRVAGRAEHEAVTHGGS